MARRGASKGGRRGVGGGKGYNPYRSGDGKFKSGPHKKRIAKERAKELKARKESIAVKKQMTAVKKKAAASKDPREKAKLKKQFDSLSRKREVLKKKADAATAKRREASDGMRKAQKEHREKQKEHRGKQKEQRKQEKQEKRERKREGKRQNDQDQNAGQGRDQNAGQGRDQNAGLGHGQNNPNWPDAAYAHTRISQPTTEIGRKLHEAEDAFGRRDLSEGRRKLEDVCAEYGLRKQVRSTNEIIRTNIPAAECADAYHDWSGRIRLSEETADRLTAFGNYAVAERSGNAGINQTRRAHDDAMRIAIHEVLHGYGPTSANHYQGVGARIEEITTETAARKIMWDHYGTSKHNGAYSQELHNAITAIQFHKNLDYDGARAELERISFAVKKQTRGVDEPFDVFLRHLGPGTLSKSEIEQYINWDPPGP